MEGPNLGRIEWLYHVQPKSFKTSLRKNLRWAAVERAGERVKLPCNGATKMRLLKELNLFLKRKSGTARCFYLSKRNKWQILPWV